jgi:hypothetical protein
MQELNLPFTTPEETAAMAVTFLDHFPAEEYLHLAELTTKRVLRGVWTSVFHCWLRLSRVLAIWPGRPRVVRTCGLREQLGVL